MRSRYSGYREDRSGSRFGWGIGFFLLGFVGTLWSEHHSLRHFEALALADTAIGVSARSIDATHDRALVHVAGKLSSPRDLVDSEFRVRSRGLRLKRIVEMRQWEQKYHSRAWRDSDGDRRRRSEFEYRLVWSERWIDSSNFRERHGHENPRRMLYTSETQHNPSVRIGAFSLDSSIFADFGVERSVPLSRNVSIPRRLGRSARVEDDCIVTGNKAGLAEVGAYRICFVEVPMPSAATIIAQQVGATLAPLPIDGPSEFSLMFGGELSRDAAVGESRATTRARAWFIRLGGCLAIFIGLMVMGRPDASSGVMQWFKYHISLLLIAIAVSGVAVAGSWVVHEMQRDEDPLLAP